MTDHDDRAWWVNGAEGVQGPFTPSDLTGLVEDSTLRADTLICHGHEGSWVSAGTAFPALFPPPPPGAPSPPPPPPAAPAPPRATGSSEPSLLPAKNLADKVDVGLSVFLSIITAEIWWLIWLYPRLEWLANLAGRPLGNRVTYFWLYVGLNAGGLFLALIFPLFWIVAFIAAGVIGSMLAYELGKDQEAIIRARGLGEPPASATTQVVLFAVACGTAVTIVLFPVAIVVAVFYFVFFFRNHNAITGPEPAANLR